jgi:DNA ligase-1
MQPLQVSETFQASTKNGETKFWRMEIRQDESGEIYTLTESWRSTKKSGESLHVWSEPKQIKGKNIGRANATTPLQQATAEMESTISRQRDKGYRLPGEEGADLPLPMLALDYKKRKAKLPERILVQPKLDGVRALYDGKKFWSRQGKIFIPEVIAHLHFDTSGEILDGELILPPPFTFQQTVSAIKKFDPTLSPKLEYHVYDLVQPQQAFRDRIAQLNTLLAQPAPAGIKSVRTISASTLSVATGEQTTSLPSVEACHAEFIEQGYEGTMIRISDGQYLINHRSADLMKLKDFVDEEFEIVAVIEGEAKEKGHAIFVLKTPNGQTFNARPRGSSDSRQQMWRDRESLIGKLLTVRYQNLSDTHVPRFPVGITIRDYE